jgi:uncharacterized membrane protein (UPF0127 family)
LIFLIFLFEEQQNKNILMTLTLIILLCVFFSEAA